MRFEGFSFGSLRIGDLTYEHDIVIDLGEIRRRNKKPSNRLKEGFGHTPLSSKEDIPWKCRLLVIGTGAYGQLPVTEDVKIEAARRKVELLLFPLRRPLQRSSRVWTRLTLSYT